MQIIRRLGIISLFFCISACTNMGSVKTDAAKSIEQQGEGIQASHTESKEQKNNIRKQEKPLSKVGHNNQETSKQDLCQVKELPPFDYTDNMGLGPSKKDNIELIIKNIGKACFKWKIKGFYKKDAIFSYKKITIVTETNETAKKLKDHLEKVMVKEAKPELIEINGSFVVIRNFNAYAFSHVIGAKRQYNNEILDIVLMRCQTCRKPANTQ